MFLNILVGGAFSFSRLVGFSEHFVAAMGAMSGCSLCRSAAGGGSPGCHRKVSTDESTQERSKFLRGCLPGSTYHRPNTFSWQRLQMSLEDRGRSGLRILRAEYLSSARLCHRDDEKHETFEHLWHNLWTCLNIFEHLSTWSKTHGFLCHVFQALRWDPADFQRVRRSYSPES